MDARGRVCVGTSGFSYPAWVPLFYAPGKASRKLLVAYASRLSAVELNNTFYRRPPPEQVAKWLRETPASFRFCPKAQRSTAWRVWSGDDPAEPIAWLSDSLGAFGERLGCVLLSARGSFERDDAALERLLRAWPRELRLALELAHPSWADAAIEERLAAAGAVRVANDWDDRDEPALAAWAPFIYLRLRRRTYATADVERWAARFEPIVAAGTDVFAFFRHDEDGQMALHAEHLQRCLGGLP